MSDAAWSAIKDYEYEERINRINKTLGNYDYSKAIQETPKVIEDLSIPDELFTLLNELLYESYEAFKGYGVFGGNYGLTYKIHYQFIKTAIESYNLGKGDKNKSSITAAYERGYQDGHEAARNVWGDNNE